MKISVIVPVYNVEQYLEQCIDSIVNQTYRDLEIILVNDGSSDGSAKICDDFAHKDNRIIVIHQQNGGVSSARNRGIKSATGDFLAFVDSDDWLLPNMYEKMSAVLQTHPDTDFVLCDYAEVRSSEKVEMCPNLEAGFYTKQDMISKIYPTLIVAENFGRIPIVSPCMGLFRKTILEQYHIFFEENLRYSEDYLFMANVLLHIRNFYFLKNTHFYQYRQIEQSRSKRFRKEWWANLLLLNQELKKLLSQNAEFDFSRQIKLQLIHSALLVTSSIYENGGMKRNGKLEYLKPVLNEPALQQAFAGLTFTKQPVTLRIVLSLIKNKKANSYLVFRDLHRMLKFWN